MKKLIVPLAALAFVGCASKYTGSHTVVGEQTALPEVSDTSDSFKVRVYESVKGAKVYTAKDSQVEIVYENAYTNSYFGIFDSNDTMKLKVKVVPLQVDAPNEEK